MILSILIPVYNEEKTIGKVLDQLNRLQLQNIQKEIIIVDDCSADGTAIAISNFIKKYPHHKVKVITHNINQGKGAAVRTGLQAATGDYIIIQDADMEYNPDDIKRLTEPIIQSKAEVVYGTRLKRWPDFRKDERSFLFLLHYIGNKMLSLLTSILYGQWITDMETGYKILPLKVIHDLHLTSFGFELEPEITAKLLKRGYTIMELPISTNPRNYKEGKKLHTVRDGFRAFWALVKYRFTD